MTQVDRGLEKAARIKEKLGGTGAFSAPYPEKPRGMHEATYERLLAEANEAEAPYWERIQRDVGSFMSGIVGRIQEETRRKRCGGKQQV